MNQKLRLGVNIDHVATLRNARGGIIPDPVQAAILVAKAGADGITAHLREDRRHITDSDIRRISIESGIPLNLEMAVTEEMVDVAINTKPAHVCVVPERREELTTEGGLNAIGILKVPHISNRIQRMISSGIEVSLFLDPEVEQINAANKLGATAVELHTGEYCNASLKDQEYELSRLQKSATYINSLGMDCHAGHGLTLDNVTPVAKIPEIIELNIGHSIISEAVFGGLESAVKKMRSVMDKARELGD